MRTLVLSDHVQAQATAAAELRQANHDSAMERYRAELDLRARRGLELAQLSARAWDQRLYVRWLLSLFSRLRHSLSAKPSEPVKAFASREEIVWNAGRDGERRVLDALSSQLSDGWVAISGYCNSGGEVDLLLVGPPGVMAVEIKYLNGEIYCDGDRWWRDKYDKYGNLVEETTPISDRGGRSPSAQVNAVADRLQRFLAQRTPLKRVLRCVVLSHDLSTIGELTSVTVDDISTIASFNAAAIFQQTFGTTPEHRVDALVSLIERDHAYHAARRVRATQSNRDRVSSSNPSDARKAREHSEVDVPRIAARRSDRSRMFSVASLLCKILFAGFALVFLWRGFFYVLPAVLRGEHVSTFWWSHVIAAFVFDSAWLFLNRR